jgi:hypothetical protein
METVTKKTGVCGHSRFTGGRLAANGLGAILIIPDSMDLGICAYLCLSVAKNTSFLLNFSTVPTHSTLFGGIYRGRRLHEKNPYGK